MKIAELVHGILENNVPKEALAYCFELWKEFPFVFYLAKSRESKLGDYHYSSADKIHTITVNKDLNKYSFLITYIHEVAHLKTTLKYGIRVKPHGEEWKSTFKELLYPVLKPGIFPEQLLPPLFKHLCSPKASSCSDEKLLRALASFDQQPSITFLSDVGIGEMFKFNKRFYIKENIIRTRSLCKEVKSGKQYYIPEAAQVTIIQKKLL